MEPGLVSSAQPQRGYHDQLRNSMLVPNSWPPVGLGGLHWGASSGASPLPPAATPPAGPQPPTQLGRQAVDQAPCKHARSTPGTAKGSGGRKTAVGVNTAAAETAAASPSAAGSSRRCQPRVTRQELRRRQQQQRAVEQQRIKELEQQLGMLRQQLQSLSMENTHLVQRQSALNATLEMQQQLAAAAAHIASGAAAGAAAAGSLRSDEEEAFTFDFASDEDADSLEEGIAGSLLAEAGSSSADGPAARAGALGDAGPVGWRQQAAAAMAAGDGSNPGGSGWFFSATLQQHVLWYQNQVLRLQELLSVLDAIPPRMQRSLEDYGRHDETSDRITAVLADIDEWTIHMAALRPDDYGVVLHNNLQEFVESTGPEGDAQQAPMHTQQGSTGGGGGSGSAGSNGPLTLASMSSSPGGSGEQCEASIWQELVEKLALTPQQEQTLEAHQALFEQRAAAMEGSKVAVLSAIADAAAKQDDQTAALELLQGAEALRASLQQDMLVKAPVMISLRKILTPMQMARLTVNCWPYYTTMKNISRAHKQRKLLAHRR